MPIARDADDAVARFHAAMDDIDEAGDSGRNTGEDEDEDSYVFDLDALEEDGSRAGKKRQRGAILKRLQEREAELESLREKSAASERELAELRGMVRGISASGNHGHQVDPIDLEYQEANKEQQALFKEYHIRQQEAASGGRAISAEEQAEFDRRAQHVEQRKYSAVARKEILRNQDAVRGQVAQETAWANITNRYPDIFSDQRARSWATARYAQKKAEGKPDTWETMDEVAEEARSVLRLGGGKPSEGIRSKLSGVGTSGGSGDPGVFRMTDFDKRMADAKFSYIQDEDERHRRYADTIGRSLKRKRLR